MLTFSAPAPQPCTVHVDVDATALDRQQTGSRDRPFGTVHAARDFLRGRPHSGQPCRVCVRGTHYLHEPLALDERDAGSAEAPILYTTDPEATTPASLSGGVAVPASAFVPAVGPTGIRLLKANLFALGLNASVLGGLANPYPKAKLELYYDGTPMVLARDPNVAPDGRTWRYAGYEAMRTTNDSQVFTLDDDNTTTTTGARWAAALADGDDLWVHGFWKFDWRDTYLRVASIERQRGLGRYAVRRDNSTPPQYPWVNGARFYALNALRLLDSAGEYYVNSTSGELWFLPPDGVLDGVGGLKGAAVVSVLPTVLSLDGANFTSFANLTLSVAQQSSLRATDVANVTFSDLSITNAGMGACVSMSGAANSSLARAAVHGCGGSAVSVGGGDRATLVHANVTVSDSTMDDFARWRRTYQPGIGFDCVGCTFANNTITNSPHAAIQGGGNDNLFERNTVSKACFGSIDVGAFYVGRSWAQRGNVVRHNRFEHIRPTEKLAQASCSQNAFYLDDQMSGYDFYGNTVVNATTGVLLGGGRRNKIHSNTFIACDTDIAFDDRGLNWQHASCLKNCTAAYPSPSTSCFLYALDAANYTSPPYSTHYPELVNVYDDHPCVPAYNVIEDNKYCHEGSKAGARFIDRDDDTIRSWLSFASNNVEDCSGTGLVEAAVATA